MELTKFDVVILMTMSLAIVIMSFTFPALGMSSENPENASDVPEFNATTNPFDLAGDFPDSPGTPSRGQIVYDEEQGSGITGRSLVWIDRPKSEGTSVELQNDTLGNGDLQIVVTDWNSSRADGTEAQDRYIISSEGETVLHDNTSWVIEFEVDELSNYQEPDMTATVDYEILENQQDSGGGLSAIPVVGTLLNAGSELASGLLWVGEVIWWIVAFFTEAGISLILLLVDIVTWAFGLMHWLQTTYFSVISAAGGYAGVILMVPGILLFAVFAKLAMIGISLMPFT